jgi:hypothetical protein
MSTSTRLGHQLGLARVGWRDRDDFRVLEVRLHERLDEAAERDGDLDALLVDVFPLLDGAVLAHDGDRRW